MTPKEKANEILDKYWLMDNIIPQLSKENAKQCALICVDEILELNIVWYDEKLVKDYPKNYKNDQTIEFWNEVKQEIEKL